MPSSSSQKLNESLIDKTNGDRPPTSPPSSSSKEEVCDCKSLLRLGSRRHCAGCGRPGCRVCMPSVIEGHGFCAQHCRHRSPEYSVALTLVVANEDKTKEARAAIWGNVADSLGPEDRVEVPTLVCSSAHPKGKVPASLENETRVSYTKQQCYTEALKLDMSRKTAHYWVSLALEMSWFDKIPFPLGKTEIRLSTLACYRNALQFYSESSNPLTWLNLGAQMPSTLAPQEMEWKTLDVEHGALRKESLNATGCIKKAAELSGKAGETPYFARCYETLGSLLAEQPPQEGTAKQWDYYIIEALDVETHRWNKHFTAYRNALSLKLPTPRIVTEQRFGDYRAACESLSSIFTTLLSILMKVRTHDEKLIQRLLDAVNKTKAELEDDTGGKKKKKLLPKTDLLSLVEDSPTVVTLRMTCAFLAAVLHPTNGSTFFNLEMTIERHLLHSTDYGRIRSGSRKSTDTGSSVESKRSFAEETAVGVAAADDADYSHSNGNPSPSIGSSSLTAQSLASNRAIKQQQEAFAQSLRLPAMLQYKQWRKENRLYEEHQTTTFYHPSPSDVELSEKDIANANSVVNKGMTLLDFIVERRLPMPTAKMRLVLSVRYRNRGSIKELDRKYQFVDEANGSVTLEVEEDWARLVKIGGGAEGQVYRGLYDPGVVGGERKKLAVKSVKLDGENFDSIRNLLNHQEIAVLLNPRFENIIVRCMHVKVTREKHDGSSSPRSATNRQREDSLLREREDSMLRENSLESGSFVAPPEVKDKNSKYRIDMFMELAQTTLERYARPSDEQQKKERLDLLSILGSPYQLLDEQCTVKLPSGLGVQIVADFGLELLKKLEVLHSMDLVHKDIKPANVLVFDDAVKFADFGFSAVISKNSVDAEAKNAASKSGLSDKSGTSTRLMSGDGEPEDMEKYVVGCSGPYVSPESAFFVENEQSIHSSDAVEYYKANDVYCLGATLLFLCLGYEPNPGGSNLPLDQQGQVTTDEYRDFRDASILSDVPREIREQIDLSLRNVIELMTRPDYGGALYDQMLDSFRQKRSRLSSAKDMEALEQELKKSRNAGAASGAK